MTKSAHGGGVRDVARHDEQVVGVSYQLREVAQLRLKNPSLSLRDLARKCDPPVSKATAHRRLQSVLQAAG